MSAVALLRSYLYHAYSRGSNRSATPGDKEGASADVSSAAPAEVQEGNEAQPENNDSSQVEAKTERKTPSELASNLQAKKALDWLLPLVQKTITDMRPGQRALIKRRLRNQSAQSVSARRQLRSFVGQFNQVAKLLRRAGLRDDWLLHWMSDTGVLGFVYVTQKTGNGVTRRKETRREVVEG